MSLRFLHTVPHKSRNLQAILFLTTRFLATQNPNPNSFPDEPTSTYYDDLVNVAGRERDFDTLRYLLNKRVRDCCFNTTNTFKFITNTADSLSILDDLIRTLTRLDRGYTRRSAFESLIARLCKLDRIEESLRIVDVMAREEYGLVARSFDPILNVLTRKKKIEIAWRVLESMRAVGVSPDLTSFNYLLTAYCYCGDLTTASIVMEKIEEEGLGADTRTYDALVLGACRAENVEGALMLLRRMEDDGVPPLYSTHAHVINVLLKLGYYAQAVKFVMIYAGKEKKLDAENFGTLANKLVKLKRFDEANLLLEEMEKRGLAMNSDKLRDYYIWNVKNSE